MMAGLEVFELVLIPLMFPTCYLLTTHLSFAKLLYDSCEYINRILKDYEQSSSNKINLQKF